MSLSPGRIFNPYPGLRPFREEESHLFFGRAQQVDELLGALRSSRFVAVMGASGSGKSSLVAAGLYPALHGGLAPELGSRWSIASLRPGANPIRNMAAALASQPELADVSEEPILALARIEATLRASALGLSDLASTALADGDGHLLVVVDQFEELFRYEQAGLGRTSDASAFVQLLLEASRSDGSIEVIITMRSDFLGDCAQYRDLPETINDGLYLVPRLTRSQLREAISAPAAVGGARLAPRLVQRVLNDAGSDPDALPLVQHALMRTWDLWEERGILDVPLDLDLYEAAGGVDDALSRHADEAFAALGDNDTRRVAEVLFKRLTEIGRDGREIRRPTPTEEIRAVAGSTRQKVEEVVEVFGRRGRSFVTVSEDDVVDISHESLIRQWNRLRTWAREEARSRDEYRRLADAAERWEMGEAALLRNPDLEVASIWWEDTRPNEDWAARYDSSFERASGYLETSRSAASRRRVLSGLGVVGLGVVAVLFALLAVRASRAEDRAELQEHIAVARLLAAESAGLGVDNRELSILVALESFRATDSDGFRVPEAEEALRAAMAEPLGTPLPAEPGQQRHTGPVEAVVFSPDGRWLATGADDSIVLLWDVAGPASSPLPLTGHAERIVAAAFSPDGRRLATADASGLVLVWDVEAPEVDPVRLPQHTGEVYRLVFSPDGDWLATSGAEPNAWLHQLDDPGVEPRPLSHTGFVYDIEFSPDSELLLTGTAGTANLWTVDDPVEPKPIDAAQERVVQVEFDPMGGWVVVGAQEGVLRIETLDGDLLDEKDQGAGLLALAVSPDGRWLATGGDDGIARLWDLSATPSDLVATLPMSGRVEELAFSHDGSRLAVGGPDDAATLYNMSDLDAEPMVLAGPVVALAFGGEDSFAIGSTHGSARLWGLGDPTSHPRTSEVDGNAKSLAFSSDSTELTVGTTEHELWRWTLADTAAAKLESVARSEDFANAEITTVAYSADGRLLATGSGDESVRIYARDDPDSDPDRYEFGHAVTSVAISPNNRWLAVGLAAHDAVLLELSDGSVDLLAGHTDNITDVAFSPGGDLLAVSSQDGNVTIWNPNAPAEPVNVLDDHDRVVSAVAFSGDGQRLATGSWDQSVLVFEVGDLDAAPVVLRHDGSVADLAWRPDGNLLAVALDNSTALWDLTAPDLIAAASNPVQVPARGPSATSVAFSPDGVWLGTVGAGGDANLWMQLDDLIDLACQLLGRNASPEEWESIMTATAPRTTCQQWPAGS